ncbi:MAG: MarR family transcriptional regulator [Halobacteriaceae archaeon]
MADEQQKPEDRLADLPPSAKLVLTVLEEEGTLTQGELAAETRLPQRTVRDAARRLREAQIVEERPSFRDARKRMYRLAVDLR